MIAGTEDFPVLYLQYIPEAVVHMSPGSGGIAMAYHICIKQSSQLPVRLKEVSDIYDCNFQFMCSISRGHALLEMMRRTFQSRIPNPISQLFIGYPLEPLGTVFLEIIVCIIIRYPS